MGFTDLANGGSGPSKGSAYGKVPVIFSRHLDTNGDGSGTKNAIGDYSSSAEIFYIQPSATQVFRITRMMVLIRGDKSRFYSDYYGCREPLTNGVVVRKQNDSGTMIDMTDSVPVKANGEWGRVCFDSEIYPSANGNTDTYLRVRWTFERAGYPIRLVGADNERLEVVLNDDFTVDDGSSDPLEQHYFLVQGYIEESE